MNRKIRTPISNRAARISNAFRIGLAGIAALSCFSCNAAPDGAKFDEQIAADTYRFPKPDGVIQNSEDVLSSVAVSLRSDYPIWRASLDASVELVMKNTTNSFVHVRIMPRLFIYDAKREKPLYWSNIDLSYGESSGPGAVSVASLPAGGSQSTPIAVKAMKFAEVSSHAWPDYAIYDFVPTGAYAMRAELEFYTDSNEKIGEKYSDFIEFTTILTAPEAIPAPSNPTP